MVGTILAGKAVLRVGGWTTARYFSRPTRSMSSIGLILKSSTAHLFLQLRMVLVCQRGRRSSLQLPAQDVVNKLPAIGISGNNNTGISVIFSRMAVDFRKCCLNTAGLRPSSRVLLPT